LQIVHEDDDLIVIDKPAGVLCVPSEPDTPSVARAVYEHCGDGGTLQVEFDQMIVHRLGFGTSGLLVFCKTLGAVRGMNAIFRTRKIARQYEVLVAGHVGGGGSGSEQGLINLPLMRDYQYPPYMRISTEAHQQFLMRLDGAVVGRKLLESPKASLTHYQVLQREYYRNNPDLPVTRMTLTSMTGRTHQLNVHCTCLNNFGIAMAGQCLQGGLCALVYGFFLIS
jgi:tRNA pseudouridine32 synthase / 23S rRNA pseudouridine746 synthase